MKKISTKKYWYLLQRARLNKFKNRKKIKKPRGNNHIPSSYFQNGEIDAPICFSLATREHRNNLLNFLDQICRLTSNNQKVRINFDKTKLLEPSGTLLFLAKIEQLLLFKREYISCKYPKDNVVEQLFQHIGLLDKLGLPPKANITADNVKYWHYVSGDSIDTSKFKSLFETYAGKLDEDVSDSLYDSMAEAVSNCIMHAYDETILAKKNKTSIIYQSKEWWMFAQCKDEKLAVVILDLGIGIPTSLRQKTEIKEYISSSISHFKKRRDTHLIEIAVQSNRSKTKLKHRGLGLPEMLEKVKSGNVGRFLVFSGHGVFYYDAKKGFESEIEKDYETSIPGTLIQWELEIHSNNHKGLNNEH